MKKHSAAGRQPITRLNPDPALGLTSEQAQHRAEAGWHNRTGDRLSKTEGQIIRDNIFTFFNLLFFALALCLFMVKAYTDMLFLGIVIINVLIGIIQELKVKRTLDKIALLSGQNARVIRDGVVQTLPPDALVLDDIALFGPGSSICADAILYSGAVEVNESLLTGESDIVAKSTGDCLLSGSFIVSGSCSARLDKVGGDSYAASITQEAKRRKKHRSEMMRDLDRMLKLIGIGIIPLGLIMFFKQSALLNTGVPYAVSSTVAAMVGMIPEGLYLLVNIALAVSVVNLARRRTLVHELSCIENLARVDTLCLDKTGTLTEGVMEVTGVLPLSGLSEGDLEKHLAAFQKAATSENATATALNHYCTQDAPSLSVKSEIPFSSERKWNALILDDGSACFLGAPKRLLGKNYTRYTSRLKPYLASGKRVLLLAQGTAASVEAPENSNLRPLGFIFLSDKLRHDVQETLAYFREQGVAIKVISGDNAEAVSEIARRAGVNGAGAYIDASSLDEDADMVAAAENHSVFGRVTPEQKRRLIRGLKESGHTVAMIGDGVNDVLALKEADCSIAMAAGSDAAQHVSQMVLLDSDFSVMPQIVREGRRVINNIERSAALFLVKNIFSFILSLILLFVAVPYPFLPIHITLISGLMIGIPSFALTFEPNDRQVRGHFLKNVLSGALPGGLVNAFNLLAVLTAGSLLGLPMSQISTVCTLLVGVTGLLVLFKLCQPLSLPRAGLIAAMGVGFFGAAFLFGPLFSLSLLTLEGWLILGILTALSPLLMTGLTALLRRLEQQQKKTKSLKKNKAAEPARD
ncbi:HAD-IC family P-type ATPase [Eubacterium sp. 1001713B170207_170306_E7]|uniref:HAD-IC family P-type ATPase n=1 Tax=Eubacterium sp. 1001713B170207_170306_E7 TaxID=2787097 RepID=UPI0018977E56|nr:HAD-IC family P-type ATPase [Eubacterium sp. 1001713B170207_170306_E7]